MCKPRAYLPYLDKTLVLDILPKARANLARNEYGTKPHRAAHEQKQVRVSKYQRLRLPQWRLVVYVAMSAHTGNEIYPFCLCSMHGPNQVEFRNPTLRFLLTSYRILLLGYGRVVYYISNFGALLEGLNNIVQTYTYTITAKTISIRT